MALDRLLDSLARRLLCFSCIFLRFSFSYVRQTKLASSLVNFWAPYKILFDLIHCIVPDGRPSLQQSIAEMADRPEPS